MRYLLDTHIFLWWIKGDLKITKNVRSKILEAKEVYVSSASIWEAAIKIKQKKLDADLDEMVNAISSCGFLELPITACHARKILHFPALHRDPFDRILVSQAICEPLTLLTADSILTSYSNLVELMK